MTEQAVRNRQLDEIERDFTAEFGPVLGDETVSKVVQESFDLISHKATVTDFVGMLARRASRARLVKLVAGGRASPVSPEAAPPAPALEASGS